MRGQPRVLCLQLPTQQAQLGDKTLVEADSGTTRINQAN